MSVVEDIYPLTPLQSGMLYHTLLEPDGDLYLDQVVVHLRSARPIDTGRFRQGWETLLQRHTALRTVLSYDQTNKLRQVVLRRVPAQIVVEDWTGATDDGEARLESFLRHDRRSGLNLSEPPLVRAALIRRAATSYTLVLTYHHAIIDAWSVNLLLKELFAIYTAGAADGLPPARPYRDFVAWLQSAAPAVDAEFWRGRFADFDGVPRLPDVLPHPRGESHAAPALVTLDADLTAGLYATARQWRTTPAILAQSAWAIVASRYTGRREAVFGATFSGRTVPLDNVQNMVGLFVSTLPVRVRLDPSQTLRQLAADVARQQTILLAHEQAPVQTIQRALSMEPGASLFDVVFAFENVLDVRAVPAAPDGSLEAIGAEYRCRTSYPLNVMIVPTPSLTLGIHHDDRAYSPASARQMLEHFRTALAAFAKGGAGTVADLELLSAADRALATTVWNATAAPAPAQTIGESIAAVARRRPDAIAVSTGAERITYGDLDRRANRLANWLRGQGADVERFVGICMDRSIDMIVAVLGALKSGAAYVPLDPSYPADRLSFMLSDSNCAVLLTEPHLVARFAGTRATVLDAIGDELAASSPAAPPVTIDPLNTAYVIYTSGSTGRPKGTLLTHGGLVNMIADWNRLFSVTDASRVLQFASFSFDASVWEITSALAAGATLCIGSRATLYSAEDLLAMLRDHAISCALLPPSLLSVLPADDLPDLASVAAIGEKCTADIASRWAPGRLFVNAYGPAEGTITVSAYRVQGAGDTRDPPIGMAMANLQLYVLDDRGQPAPVGVAGELHLGGVGLARGYLNQPGLTAARFVPDPFGGRPGARLYCTGDRARYRADGNIEFLGRIDHQVKIRGCRVELGEIESALRQAAGIRAAVVVPVEANGNMRLVAYVVAEEAARTGGDVLRTDLARRLPAHMVPSVVVRLDRFPVTPNGKIDRRALPAPDWSAGGRGADEAEPRNETERHLLESWREVLDTPGLGIHTRFFDAGGDSIASVRVVAAARRRGVSVTAAQMMQHETIAELAAVAQPAAGEAAAAARTGDSIALTPIQRWFFDRRFANPNHYNQAIVLDVGAGISSEAVAAAVRDVFASHESFRARYGSAAGAWEQTLEAEPRIAYEHVRRRGSSAHERRQDYEVRAAAFQGRFDLGRGPLCGAMFVDGGADPGLLLLSAHHLVVDAHSWRTIVRRLEAALARRGDDRAPEASGFSAWSAFLDSPVCRAQVEARSTGLRALLSEMRGVDRSPVGPAATYGACESLAVELRLPETSWLRRPRRSPETALLAGLRQTLLQATRRRAVLVAVERDGRTAIDHPLDLSRTTGWFTTMFPVRVDTERDEGVLQARLDEGAWLALLPDRAASPPAVPSASISLTHLGDLTELAGSALRLSHLSPGPLVAPESQRPFAWEFTSFVQAGTLHLRVTFGAGAGERDRLGAVLAAWRDALLSQAVVA